MAYAEGRIFAGILDGRLIALDAKTGNLLWSMDTVPPDSIHTVTGAPRVFKDKVIIGNGGADANMRGYVTAYDQKTGKQAWRFYTVPGSPEENRGNAALERAAKPLGARASTGRTAPAERCGTGSRSTPSSTASTSAPATAVRTILPRAIRAATATTCICARSSRSTPTAANTSGTTRSIRAKPGTTKPRPT